MRWSLVVIGNIGCVRLLLGPCSAWCRPERTTPPAVARRHRPCRSGAFPRPVPPARFCGSTPPALAGCLARALKSAAPPRRAFREQHLRCRRATASLPRPCCRKSPRPQRALFSLFAAPALPPIFSARCCAPCLSAPLLPHHALQPPLQSTVCQCGSHTRRLLRYLPGSLLAVHAQRAIRPALYVYALLPAARRLAAPALANPSTPPAPTSKWLGVELLLPCESKVGRARGPSSHQRVGKFAARRRAVVPGGVLLEELVGWGSVDAPCFVPLSSQLACAASPRIEFFLDFTVLRARLRHHNHQ